MVFTTGNEIMQTQCYRKTWHVSFWLVSLQIVSDLYMVLSGWISDQTLWIRAQSWAFGAFEHAFESSGLPGRVSCLETWCHSFFFFGPIF